MSGPLAIGAVTATLRSLLERGLAEEGAISVTTLPPDVAKDFDGGGDGVRVNLFLYHTPANAAWRNHDLPRQVKPGETGQPPLALDLHYLITAYERDAASASVVPHRLLGRAMSTLHDHMLLGAKEIADAFPGSELENQIERIRITPHPLTVDELSKLWTIFQTEYRISAAYQVSVVLIESTRGTKAPLPVLSRGRDDIGVSAQADLIPPYPSLTSLALPERQRTARLGTVLTIEGHHLAGSVVAVEATHLQLNKTVALAVQPGATDTRISATLPTNPDAAPAGAYLVNVGVQRAGETFPRSTDGLPFLLAPEITGFPTAPVRGADDVTVTLTCQPTVVAGQRAVLLLGDREVPAPTITAPSKLTFKADTRTQPIVPGEYFVRLRVNGVDSELVKYAGDPPKPLFDPALKITVPA